MSNGYFHFRSSNNEIFYILDIEKEPKNKVIKALISFCQDLSKNTQKALEKRLFIRLICNQAGIKLIFRLTDENGHKTASLVHIKDTSLIFNMHIFNSPPNGKLVPKDVAAVVEVTVRKLSLKNSVTLEHFLIDLQSMRQSSDTFQHDQIEYLMVKGIRSVQN